MTPLLLLLENWLATKSFHVSGDEFIPDEILGLPIAVSFGIGEPF